jgi:membrane protease YdiL (CAAX protease family)
VSVVSWLRPVSPGFPPSVERSERRALTFELLIVFAITFGLSGIRSLLSLIDDALDTTPLSQQTVTLNQPLAAEQLIDLLMQLTNVLRLVAWGALGLYLLWRAGIKLAQIGLDFARVGRDLLAGTGLAAFIGLAGLGVFLVGRALGQSLAVQPSTLDETWWRTGVLVLSAFGNAWAEEVLVVGYLLTRLRQLAWSENLALLAAAVLRGSYHLYQGLPGFVGNVAMGLVFGRLWQRTNRLWPLIIAHGLIDVVAFVGYSLLRGHVSWLP